MRHNTADTAPRRAQLPDLITELRQVERRLIEQPATIADLQDITGRSAKQCTRYLKHLRTLGVEVVDDHTPGQTEPARWRIKRKTSRVFY